MKITKMTVQNYRLLRNFTLDLEDELTLIVGKNNTGKTSVLQILDKFVNSKLFYYDDANNFLKLQIFNSLNNILEESEFSISLSIFIKYDETDNLTNIRHLMQDLHPDNNFAILNFKYGI